MVAAERRGWVFECLDKARPQATLIRVDEHARGQHFFGEGDDALVRLLDQVDEFDRANNRL